MSLVHVRWFSQTLQKQTEMQVIFPDVSPGPYPALYLLHGLSDDSSNWVRWTRIEQFAQPHPMLIVMPDGFRGFYTDNEQGSAYGRYIAEELPEIVERMFHVRTDRGSRAIGGLSMGGYGALRIALSYPDRFCSVHSHSGALGYGRTSEFKTIARQTWRPPGFLNEVRRIFGDSPDGTDHDLFALAKKAKKAKVLPSIRIDCGRDDFLLAANREFVEQLVGLRIPHTYMENDGGHTWEYWDRNIVEALKFHARTFSRLAGAKVRERARRSK